MNNVLLHLKNFYHADRKPLHTVVKELIQYTLYERELPMYYFMNLLYRPDIGNIKTFMGGGKLDKINRYYNEENIFLDNKLLFFHIMSALNFPTPEVFAYSNNESLYCLSNDEIIKEDTLLLNLKKLMYKNKVDQVFIKPLDELGGKNCFLFNGLCEEYITQLPTNVLFQEVIKQNEKINEIYPYSINTIRIYTFKNVSGDVSIISAFMRFGINKMNVDNASSGGFFVPIDLNSGKLDGKGLQLLKHGGSTYNSHPDTGYEFQGFKIPLFEEVVSQTIKASYNFNNKIIGWDIAVGDKGIVFIEGNSNGSLLMAQIACGGFKGHPGYSKLFNQIH